MSVATVYSALNAALNNGVIDLWSASAQAALAPIRGVLGLFGIQDSYLLSQASLTQGLGRVTLTGSGVFGQPGDPRGMRFAVHGQLLYVEPEGGIGTFQLSLGIASGRWTFSDFFNPNCLPSSQGQESSLGTVIWTPSFLHGLALESVVFSADSSADANLTLSGRLPANDLFASTLAMLAPWPLSLSGTLQMPANWTAIPVMELLARAAGSPVLNIGSPATTGDGPKGLTLSNLGLQMLVRDDLNTSEWGRSSFSVVNLVGTASLGQGNAALVANVSTPLLLVGHQWHLIAVFDPAHASVVRGVAQLSSIFGVPALPLPDNFPLLETFKFHEVDFTFTSPDDQSPPQLQSLALTIASEQQWSPPVPFVTLHDIGTRWVWAWGAIRDDSSVFRQIGTVSGSVFGTLRFGDNGNTRQKVDIDVSVSLPQLYIEGQMRSGDYIPIGQAFSYFFGAPGPAVGGLQSAVVSELGFAADPLVQNYSAETLVVFGTPDNDGPSADQGWDINLVVITLRLEQIGFWISAQNGRVGGGLNGVFSFFPAAADDDYESPRLVFRADYPVQDPDAPEGWRFSGGLYQGTSISLSDLVAQFLGLGKAPASVPQLTVDRLDVAFSTGDRSYELGGTISMRWTPTLFGTALKISAAASIDIAREGDAPADTPASGRLSGEFSINRIGIEVGMDVGVDEPTYLLKVYVDTIWVQAITAWRGEKDSTTNPRHQVIAVQLGGTTLGDMLEYLVNLAAPTLGFTLDSPWDVLKRIELSSFVFTLDPTNNVVEFVYKATVDLGFGSLSAIGVRYTRGGAGKVELVLEGSLLGKAYTGDNALAWDVVNDPPPAVPGTGSSLVELRYLGIGQRIRLQNPVDTVAGNLALLKQFMQPVENPSNLPTTSGSGIAFSADSQWLIGLDIGLMANTVDLGFLFNDPILYGLSVGLNGEKAGSLAGLRFEILYKKISDDVGMFRVELRLPDAFRTFQLGIASLTLGTVVIEVYTNGNFKVDLGFPYNQDFSRSFSVQAYVFIGRGGVYFGLLDGVTSSQVPRISNGTFSPVLELGIGLAVGVGREIRAGILGGGAYVEVQVIFQGVLGWFNPASAGLPSAQYFRALGIAALHGKVYGYVDFKVIKVSVSLEAYAQVSALFECYQPTQFDLKVSVRAEAKVKILFIKISFSFHVSLELSFTLGSVQQTPWIVAPGGEPKGFQGSRLLAAPGRAGSLSGGQGPRSRRNRAQRVQVLSAQHLHQVLLRKRASNTLALLEDSDWDWAPSRSQWPDGQPRSALLYLLPSISIGELPVSWSGPAVADATPNYRAAFILCANSGVDPQAPNARAEARRSASHHALATSADDTASLTPDLWVRTVLLYALYAIPEGPRSETDPLTAGQLALLAAVLDDPQSADAAFAWSNLDTLFATNLHLLLGADPGAVTEVGGMVAPLPPGLTRSGTPGGTLNFAEVNPVGPWYEWDLAQYMGQYLPVGGASGPRPTVDDPASYESFPTFIFRDYCLMLAKAAVQEAGDLLASTRVSVADAGGGKGQSLAQLAATFASATIDYPIRSGDTVESVAQALGASSAELLFLNPGLQRQLENASVGSRLAVNLGIAPEVLAVDNANEAFALGSIELGTLLHQAASGETLDAIASLFNLGSSSLLFEADGAGLGESAALLDPAAPFDLPARTWSKGPSSRLLAAATAYVRYRQPRLPPADWYAQAVFDGNAELIARLTRDDLTVNSQELPPGQVLKVPQGFNAVQPTSDYTTQPGDTLDQIAATLALVQVYSGQSPPEAADWQTFLGAVTSPGAGTYGLPASAGLHTRVGESLDALARRLLLDVNWTASSDPAVGTWQYAWANILTWAGPAAFLAPLALVPVPNAVAKATDGEPLSFTLLANTYGLDIAEAATRLENLTGLYAIDTVLTVTQVPVITVDQLLAQLLGGAALPRIVNQGSRSLMAGLRAPKPVSDTQGHAVADAQQPTPLYDLTGQQFDLAVDTAPDKADAPALALTLTAQASWISLVGSTVSAANSTSNSRFLARSDIPAGMAVPTDVVQSLDYRYSNAQIIAMGPATRLALPVVKAPAAMALAGLSPKAYGLTQRIELQTPVALPIPGMDAPPVGAQPTLWPLPADLRAKALAGSSVAYDLLTTAEGASAGRDAVAVENTTWACRISVAIKQVNDALTLFALQGVDEAERPTLLALRAWLAAGEGSGTVVKVLARPAPDAGNCAGLSVLDSAPAQTWLIQANLSTESVPRSPNVLLGRVNSLARDGDPAPAASLDELERFVTLLWEGSVVGGTGYTLGLDKGLPASAVDANGVASIDLLVIAGTQQGAAPQGRSLLPFNTCALVAPGLDATIGTLYAEDHNEEDMILQALVPAGSVGFNLTLEAPPEAAESTAELQARRLFSLLGTQIPARQDSPFSMAASGMPAPPTPVERDAPPAWKRQRLVRRGVLRDQRLAEDADPYWLYEQVLPLYRFATPSPLPRVPGLPTPDEDPYRGFGWASSLPSADVELHFQDILGNPTGANPAGQGQVSLPSGYTDPLLGVGDWPAVVSAWAVSADAGKVTLGISLEARPATVMPSPSQPGDAAAQTADRQAEAYAKAYYQLGQPLSATVETSLDTSAAHGIEQAPLWRFAAASQAFSASAAQLGAARAPANATLATLAADYSLRYTEMALANAQVPMQALFGVGARLKVPAYALFAENDTAQSITALTRPDGWPSVSAEALLAAPENGDLPLRSGTVLQVSPALTRNTGDGSANLATLANALGTLPGLLAGDNASLTILTPGITFSVAVSEAERVSVTVTEASVPMPIRSLEQVCTAFAALGVNIGVIDLGQSHQALPAIFQANQLISSTVWVAGSDDSLAHNGSGLDQAALAALNTHSVNLFEMGALLYLGDFNDGAGITADGAQTLHQFADAHACPAELLLGANPSLAVPSDGAFALPGRVSWPGDAAQVRVPYSIQSGDSLDTIAPRFAETTQALATANLEMPCVVAGGVTLDISVDGQSCSLTTAANGQSLAATLTQLQAQAPAATLTDLLTGIGAAPQALSTGALLICAAAQFNSPTAPSAIAGLLGVSAGAFALANVGTPNLIASGITLAAPHGQTRVITQANDCLNSLIVRFAEAGVQVNAQDIVDTPANADKALFAAGAPALVPPAGLRISLPIGASGPYPGPAFPLNVSLTLSRPAALINPDFAADNQGGVSRCSSPIPAPQAPAAEDQGGGLAFNAFISAMRAALPDLRIATGRALEDSRDLWAVNFGAAGIRSLNIAGATTVPGAPGPQPRFFALTPLYKCLVSRQGVGLQALKPDGTLSQASSQHDFQGIDVEPWAGRFLSDMDRILGTANVAALYRTPDTRQTLADLVTVKRQLAGAIPEGLEPVLEINDPDAVAGQAAAATTLQQQLGISLSRAWSASTLVQLNRQVTSAWQAPGTTLLPADMYGGIEVTRGGEDRSWNMSAGKCWLTDFSPFITLLLTESDPASHRSVTASMAFGITDLERNITSAGLPDGYAASQWLTFVPPLGGSNLPSALSVDLGEVSVPIPLRDFPALPVIIDQRASTTALNAERRQSLRSRRALSTMRADSEVSMNNLALWDHRFTYSHEHAEQDEVSLTLSYNLRPDQMLRMAANEVDLFVQLARYIAVADTLWEILGDLPDSGALTPVQSNAANTLRDLASAVASSWNVRLGDSAPQARLQAPVTDAFVFQARVTDRDGPQASREVASLGLTALSAGVGPDGQWPQVWALTSAGLRVELERASVSAAESRYQVPADVHVPASWPTFSLIFTRLNVARWQNATGSILVQRNQKLLGANGPATNPAFVFQTDRVEAASVATPLNTWDQRVPLATAPTTVSAALQAAFDNLFGSAAQDGGLSITAGVAYAYELATDPLDPRHGLVGETPVFLYPNQVLDGSTAGNLQTAVDTWREQANPQREGGEWVFSLTLYSALEEDRRPLLVIGNLYLPMVLEGR
ncbi:hypothetical protein PPUJ20028_10050 [Pseudomonas putida]|uniref:LysM domain-containing protein n=1 Tax=Pseudomonas putida TaxID=303 RepID=A0AA37VVR1_PSEPU|nr:LysM peptidoglycan-binding domain-containing protein [Pseudomonas putida]GLO12424.1 hypothetical protein PPUJ20028_10050 [Pseudomonas putida]GLO35194.1 hypothetical protein PPUN14671_20270 [Pseudomonas putida]HDS0966313.1 hypothetical protein [Pseudomonas putida]HDS0992601.1 hypothetical protein [Pseudomonas putida]